MVKSISDKSKSRNNFHKKMEILKEDYKLKENLYSDTLCRLIKDISRQLVRNQTEEALFEAKRKTIELALVATEEQFKNMAEACSKTAEFNKIIAQINKTSERKARKKCEVIAVVNYVRRMIKGIQTSGKMDNLHFQKEQETILETFKPKRDTNPY